jgi:hypothetical protein
MAESQAQAEKPGNVYVFNLAREEIQRLHVAEETVGSIPHWVTEQEEKESKEPKKVRYTPSGLAVPRSKEGTSGTFRVGTTAVTADWESFSGRGSIVIPKPTEGPLLTEDLILFISTKEALLMSINGKVLSTVSLSVEGDRAAADA